MKRTISMLTILAATSIASNAFARVDLFVHGRNMSQANVTDYWHIGQAGDAIAAFTGNNSEGNYTYGYDTTYSYSNLSDDTKPVCALTHALMNAPGTDFALISHSAGGPTTSYMMAWAFNYKAWGSSGCTYQPQDVVSWVTYWIPVAAPFRGTEVANAIYGNTSGNWLQSLCGSAAGAIANLVFNQASDMTWALQTSFMNNGFNSLTAYGSFSAVYQQYGTANKGDDSTGLWWAQYCANVEGACGLGCTPRNDGFISPNSANGCARGTAVGTNCMPGGHAGWHDAVGHSSNRRNDYLSFAANVWAYNPY